MLLSGLAMSRQSTMSDAQSCMLAEPTLDHAALRSQCTCATRVPQGPQKCPTAAVRVPLQCDHSEPRMLEMIPALATTHWLLAMPREVFFLPHACTIVQSEIAYNHA